MTDYIQGLIVGFVAAYAIPAVWFLLAVLFGRAYDRAFRTGKNP